MSPSPPSSEDRRMERRGKGKEEIRGEGEEEEKGWRKGSGGGNGGEGKLDRNERKG